MCYSRLCANVRRDYGYTSVGQFFEGLKNIIHQTLFSPDYVPSSATQYFAETAYCAAKALHCGSALNDIADRVLRQEYAWQAALWKKIFDTE